MKKNTLYGATHGELVQPDAWNARRIVVTRFYRRQYTLPGGATGRHFVDMTTQEVDKLLRGQAPSDRLVVLLQRDSLPTFADFLSVD